MQTVINKTQAQTIGALFKDIFKETSSDSITCDLQSILGVVNYYTNISNDVKTINKSVFVDHNVNLTISTSVTEVKMLICVVLSTNEKVDKPEDIYSLDDRLVFSSFRTVSPAIYHEYMYNEDPKVRMESPLSFDMSFSGDDETLDLVEHLLKDKVDGFIPILDIATTMLDEHPLHNIIDKTVIIELISSIKAQALTFIDTAK